MFEYLAVIVFDEVGEDGHKLLLIYNTQIGVYYDLNMVARVNLLITSVL